MTFLEPYQAHGWILYGHPMFLEQVEAYSKKVGRLQKKHPSLFQNKNDTKVLQAIYQLTRDIIPQDPAHKKYRQGSALDKQYRHWFRAKFFQQYRLFFRFHQASKIIVFGWVNDENPLRAYGSKKDAYVVFKKMLTSGHPPDDWDALVEEAKQQKG